MRQLLDAGADPALPGPQRLTALHEAAMHGRLAVTKLLLARGAPTEAAAAPACSVAEEPSGGIVCSIEREGSALFDDDEPAPAGSGGGESEAGVEPQYTPLHAAAEWGHVSVLVVLLEAGASLQPRDDSGRTALELCEAAQSQRTAQGQGAAAARRAQCVTLLRAYTDAEAAQQRAAARSAGDDDGPDGAGGISETDVRLRGFGEALSSCPQSVRWRQALVGEVGLAAEEIQALVREAADEGQRRRAADRDARIEQRHLEVRMAADEQSQIESDMQSAVEDAVRSPQTALAQSHAGLSRGSCGQEHAADRKESKRRWALHDAVQAFKKAVRTVSFASQDIL